MLKVYALLAAATTLSRLVVVLIMGPYQIPGRPWDSVLQGEAVVWFGMFGAVAGLATIVATVRYSRLTRPAYPGLTTGLIATAFYTDVFGPNLIRTMLN